MRHRLLHETAARGRAVVLVFVPLLASIVAGKLGVELPFLQDFIEYWTAGRLNLTGSNPYDPGLMLELQQALRPEQSGPIMMWNPPWTLALVMPLASLDFAIAGWLWLATQLTVLLACTQWLWRFFGGRELGAWIASLICLMFPPTFYALGMGQISPLLLLGLCGFLYCEQRGWWVAAGICASLTLIKPHYLYLFWIALLVWGISRRHWKLLASVAVGVSTALAVALAANPEVLGQYLTAVREYPPDYFLAPTAGVLARVLIGWDKSWPQFVPAIFGSVWFWWYWRKHGSNWDWRNALSPVLIVSALTAAYGWSFDQVVLVVPMLWMMRELVRSRSLATGGGLVFFVAGSVLLVRLWALPLFVASAESQQDLLFTILYQPNMFWHIAVIPIFAAGFALSATRNGLEKLPPSPAEAV